MVNLARAFEIALPPGGTKRDILPTMIAAEQRGVFSQQPKHPWYLRKAHQTSDIAHIPMPPNPDYAVTAPSTVPVVQDAPPQTILTRTGRKENDYRRKQRLLKEAGVAGAFGITKQAMDELAAEHGIS